MQTPRKKKSLGQHHLRSGSICRPAVEDLEVAGRHVVEIGPGGGVLTRELLRAGCRQVTALELDPEWFDVLRRELDERVVVLRQDALAFDWGAVEAGDRVCGNLPYNIASPLMEALLDAARPGLRCSFLIQKEMADRWCAAPGDAAYGSFSVLVAARCRRITRLSRVRPGSFDPPPKVDSAFVGLELGRLPEEGLDWPAFKRTVRAAFAQRRKTLRNSLASVFGAPRTRAALDASGIDPGLRAERLGLTDFLALHRALGENPA